LGNSLPVALAVPSRGCLEITTGDGMRELDVIAATLRTVLPDGARIGGVVPMTTGFSNDTYLIEGANLILRLPPAAGAMLDGHDVLAQARIYRALSLADGAPPVPAIIHIEDDPAVLGAPFFVMQRIPGESVNDLELQEWFTGASDALRRQMSLDWVSAFSSLARLAPLGVLGAPVDPEEDLRKWQKFAKAANCPVLVDQIERLLKVPASLSGPPAVIQGDPKLSNLMWQDYRITAMLDWEMSLNGEPLADLGYMLYLFESEYHPATRAPKQPGMIGRAEAIACWEQVSGRSADGVFWHEIAQIAKITAIIAEGCNMFDTGRSSDPKLHYFKANLEHYLGVVDAMLVGYGL
jgi:aminoglycoside phosphotransferase (APT) family kinase protein